MDLKSCCVVQYRYDDERDKTVFLNTTTYLQDQDHSVQDQDQERSFWSQSSLVLRPTVSDHLTDRNANILLNILTYM